MSKQNTQLTTFTLPVSEASSTSDGGRLLKKYLFHWPLFVLCAIVALVGAYFYVQNTQPVYPIVATLEFKSPVSSEGGTVINKNGTEQQLDPINTPVIVENEIEVMQSKKLMYQVVNDLQLWVSYVNKKTATDVELYKNSPVKFNFSKQNGAIDAKGIKLLITIKDANSFVLKDKEAGDKSYKFSTVINGDFGTWFLTPTSYINDYIGSEMLITVQDPDLVSDNYQSKVKVELENKDAPFVNLSTSDIIPARGKDILNSLMSLYQKDALLSKGKDAQSTLNFINSRLDSINKGLNIAEIDIQQYKSSQGMTDITSQAQGFRDIRQANIKASNDVKIQLGIIEGLAKWVNSGSAEKLPATSAYLQDPSLMGLYDKLAALQVQRAQLLATTPETNPLFEPLNEQIATLREAFKEKIAATKASLLATQKQMESFDSGLIGSLKKIPDQDRKYNSMKREQESKERIYTFLLEKREQVALRYASSVSDSEVVDDAHANKAKWPKPAIIYPLALIIGLAAGAGILYGRESLNERILVRRQIEDKVNVPVLGELSYQESTTPIVVTEGRGKFAIGEQFRVLRTNLFHLHGNNDPGRVTLFTSSIGGEGKSFVSSNLAVTLAYAKRKTILLEMDLRKPKISGVFDLSPDHPGISDFLAEKATDLDKLIQKTAIEDLDVLGCGPILPNPSELLEKETLDNLINMLKERYDDIIIDSPPIHLVTDALIIARTAHATLYMVRQGYTHKDELEFINEIDASKRLPKYSLVFNGVRRDKFGYGYGYSYGYNNSYYNSYAEKEKESFGEQFGRFLKRF
ncbi:polysaccharide biosynthesis tyrosine autokinase [Mucilaginibacter pallidiroseus]|uniref:non-specific protein-tyrosine kinase n=1 Tax=Mucilaginibacter pallidiroseus TaxID=2599295 RepID=A0A563U8J1_9SPHI|nr:tyrosine-protein kinase [Mucilaginibacter pallidiroseus]TWR27599.1 polysaccharide biosynthesis tyrosine autokinase [Mucilaginibacter pallidiroseus]